MAKCSGGHSSAPSFAVFLLPTLRLPFHRRRVPSPSEPDLSHVQSLTSSQDPGLSISPPPPRPLPTASPTAPIYTEPRWWEDSHEDPVIVRKRQQYFAMCDANQAGSFAHKPPRYEPRWAAAAAGRGPGLWHALPDTIRCGGCAADFAFDAQIISKGFVGRHGRAWLVSPPSAVGVPSCPVSPLSVYGEPDEGDDQSGGGGGGGSHGSSTSTSTSTSKSKSGSWAWGKKKSQAEDAPRRRRKAPRPPSDLVNIRVGPAESRQLATGLHVVADIFCAVCDSKVGWKYVDAKEPDQKYKVGKFILEVRKVVPFRSWEDAGAGAGWVGRDGAAAWKDRNAWRDYGHGHGHGDSDDGGGDDHDGDEQGREREGDDDGPVMFDSEDEDECEELFSGVWDAETVARRRKVRACGKDGAGRKYHKTT